VGVRVAEEVLEILPVVRDHPVGDVEVFGQGLVPEIERRDALVTSVVGVDVVVAGVPAVRGHVDPAIELDLDRRPLAGPHVDLMRLGLVLESAPHFELGVAHGERDREAAVGVEVVVVTGRAQDAREAPAREVAAPVGGDEVDARRKQTPDARPRR